MLCYFLFFVHYAMVDFSNVLILLGKLDLTLNSIDPLVQVILRFGAQYIFPVFVFYLEAILLFGLVLNQMY